MATSRDTFWSPPFGEQNVPGSFPENFNSRVSVAYDLSTLSEAIKARRAEYTREQMIQIRIGTWNVAAIPGTESDIDAWFANAQLDSQREPRQYLTEPRLKSGSDLAGKYTENAEPADVGIYVLGLQEIVDVSSPTETLKPYVDPGPSNRWKETAQRALPPGYQLISESQLVGLLLLVYAAPFIAPVISSVSATSVGTGLMGYMGNKGAVMTRIVLGETTSLVFINCHLAAGTDKGSLDRRNWDAAQIVGRAKFDRMNVEDSFSDEPDGIDKEDFAFWFGDLNYRLDDIPGDDVRRILTLHATNEYDTTRKPESNFNEDLSSLRFAIEEGARSLPPSSPLQQRERSGSTDGPIAFPESDLDPHSDPASLQTTLASLLPHDQLRTQQRNGKAFHQGWREGEINFLPTYKYDIGSAATFDSSEKQRSPSWCDRILFRSKQDRLNYEQQAKEAAQARQRDEEMKARGLDKAADADSVLFDYDPEIDTVHDFGDYDETEDPTENRTPFETQVPFDDRLKLIHYTSHQDIVSSDHKPLDADFLLTYQAVIPDLRARVYQEVFRQLDRAENEARPDLTVVIDQHGDSDQSAASHDNVTQDPNAVCFGDVLYKVPVVRSLTIANTGGISATFSLSEKPSAGGGRFPSWLSLHIHWPPDKRLGDREFDNVDAYTLTPGESANVELTACIADINHVRSLNNGSSEIEDVVVLRVISGRDHFIPVHGIWLPTCFGRSLEELTHIPDGGARCLRNVSDTGSQSKDSNVRLSAPRELLSLTEAISDLVERAIAEWGMTKAEHGGESPPWIAEPHGAGWPFNSETWTLRDPAERAYLLACIREALDTGSSISSIFSPEISSLHQLEALAETLIAFLQSFTDGIIPAAVWQDMEQQLIVWERSKSQPLSTEGLQAWVLDSLLAYSPVHSISFTFLAFVLAQIATEIAPIPILPAKPTPAQPPVSATGLESRLSMNATSPSSPSSPLFLNNPFISGGSLRHRARTLTSGTLSEGYVNPAILRRQAVESALSSIFANVMISSNMPPPSKERDKRAWEDRKKSIIQPFLRPLNKASNS